MAESNDFQAGAFLTATLRSERTRILLMLPAFGLIGLLGLYRTVVPFEGQRYGPYILAVAVPFVLYEIFALRLVGRSIRLGTDLPRALTTASPLMECAFPLALGLTLILHFSADPYAVLYSPGYAFLYVAVGLSPLHLDPRQTVLTGGLGTAGYAGLVVLAHAVSPEPAREPATFYLGLALMLGLMTGAMTLVTAQVRTYVFASVREVELRRQSDLMLRDLELARDIQRGLLPKGTPELEGYEVAALSRAAELAGGDYYDWQRTGRGGLVVSIADVTGHGIGPALVTAACRAYVRALYDNVSPLRSMVDQVNRLLTPDLVGGRFVTFAIAEIDPSAHTARLCSAGHGPTVFLSARDGSLVAYNSSGLPLGVMPETDWDEPRELRFEPGDALVLVSDGYFEVANASGELFGLDRLYALLRAGKDESAEGLLAALDAAAVAWQGDGPQQDDMTAVIVRRLPA